MAAFLVLLSFGLKISIYMELEEILQSKIPDTYIDGMGLVVETIRRRSLL
jgi:hypothetical protein